MVAVGFGVAGQLREKGSDSIRTRLANSDDGIESRRHREDSDGGTMRQDELEYAIRAARPDPARTAPCRKSIARTDRSRGDGAAVRKRRGLSTRTCLRRQIAQSPLQREAP